VVVQVDQLNPTERSLWDAFPTGRWVDVSGGDADTTRPTVRAEVLAALLRGVRPAEPGQAAGIRLRGARITGVLDLTYATVTVPLCLEDCHFDDAPDFVCANTRGIIMDSCELPGFSGRLMRVDGSLDLRRSTIRGQLSLIRATVTGEVRLNGARLLNPDGWGLFAGGLTVESAFFASFPMPHSTSTYAPLVVEGGFRLVGARLLGGLFLSGAQLRNPGKVAFSGENMTLFGRMLCDNGFRAEGDIELPHARVEGELSFAGAVLEDADATLSLTNAKVDDLNLRAATPIGCLVDLRHAHCAVLRDSPSTWPTRVALDGLVYDAIDAGDRGLSVAERLTWLGRQPHGYRPQPYEQLAELYRRLGADADARRVLLAKQRRHQRELRPAARVLGRLLDWTVGYGYRPWRAALWLAVMLGVGTAVFSARPPTPVTTGRRFDAVMYTFDLLLPISAFGLRDSFIPVGSTRWLAYGLTAAGWLLLTALVAGVTRALRRD
jgi:hypothetical protein